ncbi:hypothetical protein SAMN05443549_101532 [Flavobacterium fluvii]|uniref:Uncharacterized protein n=1 Tax=Flavobacterium fluvii TaxID=468056 RepID=A0A1M5EXN5_9FLAO|nr:hypothetical protein SAMN05443549_101532 [Flavobacterium fluvii]
MNEKGCVITQKNIDYQKMIFQLLLPNEIRPKKMLE